jgi:hypothetical protein
VSHPRLTSLPDSQLTLSPALIEASQSRPAPPTRAPSLDYFNHRFTTQSSTSPYDVRTPLASSYRSRRDAPTDPGNDSPKSSWTNLTGLFNSSVMALRSPTTPSGTPGTPSFGSQLSPALAGAQQGRGSSSRSPTRLVRGVSDSPEPSRSLAARQSAQTKPMLRGMSSSPAFGIPSVAVIRESPSGSIVAPVMGRKRIVVKFSDPHAFSFVPFSLPSLSMY